MASMMTRRAILTGVMASSVARANSSVADSVRAMEAREGLTILDGLDAVLHRWREGRPGGFVVWPAVSPDGRALCWGSSDADRSGPFLTVDSLKRGVQRVEIDGYWTESYVLSSGPDWALAIAKSKKEPNVRRTVIVDLGGDVSIAGFSVIGTVWSISGGGDLVASIAGFERVSVNRLDTGEAIYEGPGTQPMLSPDGQFLAVVIREKLLVVDLAMGTSRPLLSRIPVKGVAGWSPNGEFLLAGAWTRRLALYKRLVAIDATSDRYGEISTLGEGDYGLGCRWISKALMER